MRKLLLGFDNILTKIERMLLSIGSFALLIMMFLVGIDVMGRNLINKPLLGSEEITEILMVIAIYFGISYTQRFKGHVGMDLFINNVFKGLIRKVAFTIIMSMSIFITLFLSYYTFLNFIESYQRGLVSVYLHWPIWYLPLVASIGFLILAFRLIIEWFEEMSLQSKKE